jgi:hypothetical protein
LGAAPMNRATSRDQFMAFSADDVITAAVIRDFSLDFA